MSDLDDLYRTIGSNLRLQRKARPGLSLEDLSHELKIHRQTIWRYEVGKPHIDILTLNSLAEFYGIPTVTLLFQQDGSYDLVKWPGMVYQRLVCPFQDLVYLIIDRLLSDHTKKKLPRIFYELPASEISPYLSNESLPVYKKIGAILIHIPFIMRCARNRLGWSSAKLSEQLNVSERTIRNWEKKGFHNLHTMFYVSNALNLLVEDFFDQWNQKEIQAKYLMLMPESQIAVRLMIQELYKTQQYFVKWRLTHPLPDLPQEQILIHNLYSSRNNDFLYVKVE